MDKKSLILGMILGAAGTCILLPLIWHLRFLFHWCFLGLLRRSGSIEENQPRSLSNMETMVLPMVRRDFPESDPEALRQQAAEYLTKAYSHRQDFRIHRLVFHDYRGFADRKALILQAAVCIPGDRRPEQRLELRMEPRPGQTWAVTEVREA